MSIVMNEAELRAALKDPKNQIELGASFELVAPVIIKGHRGLHLWGNHCTLSAKFTGRPMIQLEDCMAPAVSDLFLFGGKNGLACFNCVSLSVYELSVTGAFSYGLFLGGKTTGTSGGVTGGAFNYNGLGGVGAGIAVGDRAAHFCHDLSIIGVACCGNATIPGASAETGTGIRIAGDQTQAQANNYLTRNIVVNNCTTVGNGSSGITSQWAKGVEVINCHSSGNGRGYDGEHYGVRFYGGDEHILGGGSYGSDENAICVENKTTVTCLDTVRLLTGGILVKLTGAMINRERIVTL